MKACVHCAEFIQDAATVCRHCNREQAPKKARFSELTDLARHPLVVLAVATIIGSAIVPMVNASIERDRRFREAKAERASTLLRSARDLDRKLNLVFTEFTNFQRDEVAMGVVTPDSRRDFKSRVYARYEDFNRDAWWGHWQTLEDVMLLDLLDDAADRELSGLVTKYHDNLVAASGALDPLWTALVRDDHSTSETAAKVVADANAKLIDLHQQRKRLALEMAQRIRQ